MKSAFLLPPCSVKGMTILNREMFTKTVQVPAIKLPAKQCSLFRKHFKEKILHHPKIKGIRDYTCSSSNDKLLLLEPVELTDEEMSWVATNDGSLVSEELELKYQHYSAHEVLQAVLPVEIVKDVPSSFEQIGHIAHLNLREEQLPYKGIIGEVILDKQPGIETVVNKLANIEETFRFFKMDLLAGKDDLITTVRENGCTFTFDFSKVYWNSRLHTEHKRVISTLQKNDVVLDVFAGVGPFAIPACRKGCIVHANDLNPHAHSSLISNAEKNKVSNYLHAYCLDGREFIQTVVADLIAGYKGHGPIVSHVLMNLPAIAVEFLDVFKGLFNSLPLNARSAATLPRIHCYCFSKAADPVVDSVQQVQKNLGYELAPGSYNVFSVRDVAPSKLMMKVSFDLPQSVAYWTGEGAAILPASTTVEGDDLHQKQLGTKRKIEDGSDDVRDSLDEGSSGCSPPPAKKEIL